MRPVLEDGDRVLIAPGRDPRVGDVVVARHPFQRSVVLVKRLTAFDERGSAALIGDNPDTLATTDSRSFGNVPADLLLGPVTARLPPAP